MFKLNAKGQLAHVRSVFADARCVLLTSLGANIALDDEADPRGEKLCASLESQGTLIGIQILYFKKVMFRNKVDLGRIESGNRET